MNINDFHLIEFRGFMPIKYNGKIYALLGVNFIERLLAIKTNMQEDLYWVRMESCEIIKTERVKESKM